MFKMTYKASLKVSMCALLLCLSGCNRYSVETSYDEVRKTKTCSLKDHLLKLDTSFFSGSSRLELNLDKINSDLILAHFSLMGSGKKTFFKPMSDIVFIVTHKDKSTEEIILTSISPTQNKEGQTPIYSSVNGVMIVTHSNHSESIFTTEVTRDQILKIAGATKVKFSLETISGPLIGDLDQDDMKPIQEFIDKCLMHD